MTLSLVLRAIALVSTVTAVLLTAAVVAAAIRNRAQRARDEVQRVWAPMLDRAVGGALQDPRPPRRNQRAAVLALWSHYMETVTGPAAGRLIALAGAARLDRLAAHLLAKGNTAERLLAITALGHLRDASAWSKLAQLATSGREPYWEPAATALIRIDVTRGVRLLAPFLGEADHAHPARCAAVLAAAPSDDVAGALAEVLLEVTSPSAQARLVRVLAATRSTRGSRAVRHLLATSSDPDVLSACLILIAAVRDHTQVAAARALVDHPVWFVRVHAASALGRIGDRSDEPTLTAMLADDEWRVSRAAADALARAPFGDLVRLIDLRSSHPHEGARTALAHALVECEVAS